MTNKILKNKRCVYIDNILKCKGLLCDYRAGIVSMRSSVEDRLINHWYNTIYNISYCRREKARISLSWEQWFQTVAPNLFVDFQWNTRILKSVALNATRPQLITGTASHNFVMPRVRRARKSKSRILDPPYS